MTYSLLDALWFDAFSSTFGFLLSFPLESSSFCRKEKTQKEIASKSKQARCVPTISFPMTQCHTILAWQEVRWNLPNSNTEKKKDRLQPFSTLQKDVIVSHLCWRDNIWILSITLTSLNRSWLYIVWTVRNSTICFSIHHPLFQGCYTIWSALGFTKLDSSRDLPFMFCPGDTLCESRTTSEESVSTTGTILIKFWLGFGF